MDAVAVGAEAEADAQPGDPANSPKRNGPFTVNETYFELGSKVLEAESNKAYIMDPVTQLSDHAPSLRAHNANQRQPVVIVTSPEDRAVFESRRSLLLESASQHASQAYRTAMQQVRQSLLGALHFLSGHCVQWPSGRPVPLRVKQLVERNIVPVEVRSQLWSLSLGESQHLLAPQRCE